MGQLHIRLHKQNAKDLKILMGLYRKLCREYDLSHCQQVNRLIAGRLKVAIREAQEELIKGTHCCND